MAKQPNKKKSLGRSFDSLIPTDIISEEFDPTAAEDKTLTRSKHLLIQDIIPNPDQPRKEFKQEALDDLARSIKEHGLIQPIVVVLHKDGKYRLIAGERRWRAAQIAGLDRVPALIRKLSDQAKLEVALIENIQREDLTALEMATAFLKLQEQFNMKLADIGARVGKADSTVSNTMRLLKLPDPAKRALSEGKISEQHARAILALEGQPQRQQELLDYILKYDWTSKKAEQFVVALKQGASDAETAAKRTQVETPETKAIGKKLNTQVRVRHMAKGGRLIIQFKDDKDFKRITDKLS